jgi:short-subunit dehydrogenase
MRLEGRSVLVTGATGGIGGAIVHELAARGCIVTATGRQQENLERLVSELGPPARGFAADLTTPAGVREVLDRTGPVDALVACAGVGVPEDLAGLSDEALEEAIRVNLLAPAALARAVIPQMKQRGEGHIVFISSVAALVATTSNGTMYTATKWGLRGLWLGLRHELHKTGIGVSTVFPGPVRDAGMFARTGVALPRGTGTSSPQDVARAVVRAIERDRRAITVATGTVRLGRVIGVVAPGLVAMIARLGGARRVREAVIEAVIEAEHRRDGAKLGG